MVDDVSLGYVEVSEHWFPRRVFRVHLPTSKDALDWNSLQLAIRSNLSAVVYHTHCAGSLRLLAEDILCLATLLCLRVCDDELKRQ